MWYNGYVAMMLRWGIVQLWSGVCIMWHLLSCLYNDHIFSNIWQATVLVHWNSQKHDLKLDKCQQSSHPHWSQPPNLYFYCQRILLYIATSPTVSHCPWCLTKLDQAWQGLAMLNQTQSGFAKLDKAWEALIMLNQAWKSSILGILVSGDFLHVTVFILELPRFTNTNT